MQPAPLGNLRDGREQLRALTSSAAQQSLDEGINPRLKSDFLFWRAERQACG